MALDYCKLTVERYIQCMVNKPYSYRQSPRGNFFGLTGKDAVTFQELLTVFKSSPSDIRNGCATLLPDVISVIVNEMHRQDTERKSKTSTMDYARINYNLVEVFAFTRHPKNDGYVDTQSPRKSVGKATAKMIDRSTFEQSHEKNRLYLVYGVATKPLNEVYVRSLTHIDSMDTYVFWLLLCRDYSDNYASDQTRRIIYIDRIGSLGEERRDGEIEGITARRLRLAAPPVTAASAALRLGTRRKPEHLISIYDGDEARLV
ncbi:hypothetical protein HPB50_009875 [Hyalomma asiaticum]|uniref:Uncharacterized protein n=1 Tax=Hyalomma asiaticum TaxID=266040 RepID=A0ACB7RVF4_HYAAI|nr:hypothetical protein HPB50_009875 [Hyalomma asiaticum]